MTEDAGRVVLVTGAGKGLGAAFAEAWAARGAYVVVNNRSHPGQPSSAAARAAAIEAAGGTALADTHAVDAPGAAAAMVAAAIERFGRLDALILNAGISGEAVKVDRLDTAELRRVLDINFFANHALVQAALPALLAAPAGRILFVSSSAGLHGVRGRAAYAASKGALNAYALSLADELRRTAVRVNVIAPYAATAMTAASDAAEDARLAPARAARVAVWLTSAACSETGQIWVSGADHARRARVIESRGGPVAGLDPEALQAASARLGDLTGGQAFAGAEAAFASFFADAAASAPTPQESTRCDD